MLDGSCSSQRNSPLATRLRVSLTAWPPMLLRSPLNLVQGLLGLPDLTGTRVQRQGDDGRG